MTSCTLVKFSGRHDIGNVNGCLTLKNLPVWVLLTLSHVLFNHLGTFHDDPVLVACDCDDSATRPL